MDKNNNQEEKFQDAYRKAMEFGKAYEELQPENQKRLVYEVCKAIGKIELWEMLNSGKSIFPR